MTIPTTDREAATEIIEAVIAAGWGLTIVNDGEEEIPVTTVPEALDAIFAVDMAHLHATRGNERSWMWFVLGNDPDEVVADHTVNLSDAIDPVTNRWWF